MTKIPFLATMVFLASVPIALAQPPQKGHQVRWDLPQIVMGTALVGGLDTGRDASSGDIVTLTGSGDAEPAEKDAAGGGTFVHRHANGTEVAHGVYLVTGFVSWQPAGGALPIADGIGHVSETSAGILMMTVRLFPSGGSHVDGVLGVDCHLLGATFDIEEGITLAVDGFHFVQNTGVTLFHLQK